jgi:hypothetical protein
MMRHISPQGVAKLNRDSSRGICLENTLKDITTAFSCMRQHRMEVEKGLLRTAHQLLSLMKRVPTTEEMVLLSEVPTLKVMMTISQKIDEQPGDSLEDILEELASDYSHSCMVNDAKLLSSEKHLPISIIRLAPTVPVTSGNPTATTMARCLKRRILVGPSAIVSWFTQVEEEYDPRGVQEDPATATSPASGESHMEAVLGGILKKCSSPSPAPVKRHSSAVQFSLNECRVQEQCQAAFRV